MKQLKSLLLSAITLAAFSGCQKNAALTQKINQAPDEISKRAKGEHEEDESGNGHVYTLSNQVNGNKVLDYQRAGNGSLTFLADYPTGGNGTGGGLGNQGAVIFGGDDENKILLAVNAGSNTISCFTVNDGKLKLRSTVSSGGMQPVSITQQGNVVFVLNAGGDGNISGFRLSDNSGELRPIANSTRPLSSGSAGAAQISFVNEGRVLAITEKAINKILTYTVNEWGIPGDMHSITSANPTPFGFAVGQHGNIFVSEAAGGTAGAGTLSSYRVYNNGAIQLTQGPLGTNQSAPCWVVITNNGKYAYTTNTASNNLSTFNINAYTGNISVLNSISATTEKGPIDAALSKNSKFLYVLNSGSYSINAYKVADDGSLSNIQT